MTVSDDEASHDETLPEDPGDEPRRRAPRLSLRGYVVGEAIGEGGMGEVLLARDPDIGRDVAIKRMRSGSPSGELVERFLREAKIQARLDHPAIVPVYELGCDDEGRPYFTMKRLAGTTLQARLVTRDASLQSLLRAFVDVCLAIDFAHARGVVHRDLKPANIMLGDYGEVYVLDWGVARIVTRGYAMTPAAGSPSVAPDSGTQAGALLGTPGYMAPEQARGEEVGPEADVYSLGCILFEILAAEPLHPRGVAAIASTLTTPEQAPSRRRPDRQIAPELELACTSALAADPLARPSARALADRVQLYLDGDRDLERRRALAAELMASARAQTGDVARRAEAIRDAGRAVALDPESAEASALVMTLMLEPPRQLPAPLLRQLDDSDLASSLKSARDASIALTASFALLPLLLWTGIANAWLVAAVYALITALVVDARLQVRRGRTNDFVPLVIGAVTIVLASQLLSVFVLVPVIIIGFVVGLGGQPQLLQRPRLTLAVALGTFVVPLVLEATGVFARTWEISHGRLHVTSSLVRLDGTAAYVALIGTHAFVLAVLCIFLQGLSASRRSARRAIEIQAWQLRQLLPAPPPSRELEALIAGDCRE